MSKIILLGEAYGAKEELFAHPFVGSSGAELARMLAQVGVVPELPVQFPSELDMIHYWARVKEECDITLANVFPIRPADNKIELFFTTAKEGLLSVPPLKKGKYLRPDLLFHLENLWELLAQNAPNLIVALGNTASWATLGESGITAIRGTVKVSPRLGLKVLPTYHPAAVLRNWPLRPIVLSDFNKAKEEAEFASVKRIERWMTVEPTLAEIAEWIERPADFYAVDIETSVSDIPIKQIAMLGLARSPADAIVIPFADDRNPGWNYWPTLEEEVSAWKLAHKVMNKPVPKVFQNGIYDLSYMLRAGFRPQMCNDDTMLLHHALYPEMLKGLGFLGSIYSREIAWKTMRTKGNNLNMKRDE